MNFYSIASFGFAAFILIGGIFLSSDNPIEYIDAVSIFVVFGGTLAATSVSFRIEKIYFLVKFSLLRFLSKDKVNYKKIIQELMSLADTYRKDPNAFKDKVHNIDDFFLKEALELVLDETLDEDSLEGVLIARATTIYQRYLEDAQKFKVISKYPPAFGMMGTTIGMISLLGTLGTENAIATLGPSMSICMITTLYGVALSNLAIMPIAENLISSAREVKLKNQIVAEGVLLLIKKENPIVLAEKLNSHLLPTERIDWKNIKEAA